MMSSADLSLWTLCVQSFRRISGLCTGSSQVKMQQRAVGQQQWPCLLLWTCITANSASAASQDLLQLFIFKLMARLLTAGYLRIGATCAQGLAHRSVVIATPTNGRTGLILLTRPGKNSFTRTPASCKYCCLEKHQDLNLYRLYGGFKEFNSHQLLLEPRRPGTSRALNPEMKYVVHHCRAHRFSKSQGIIQHC